MSAYNELRNACRIILTILQKADGLREDFKTGLKTPLALFNIGGETMLVELMSYLIYGLRSRLRNKDYAYFKSKPFRSKLDALFKERGIDKEITPEEMAEVFEYVGGQDIESILTPRQYNEILNEINVIEDNYVQYVNSA